MDVAVTMSHLDETLLGVAAAQGAVLLGVNRVASWWHTDTDLGRELEVIANTTRRRLLGWTGYVSTERALLGLVDRYRAERLVPSMIDSEPTVVVCKQ